jgi:hypothetical protein
MNLSISKRKKIKIILDNNIQTSYITNNFNTGIGMSTLPHDQNSELKEGWLKTIKAIEKRCVKPFPPHIKRHKIYQKGSLPTEEITELVRMVRIHEAKYGFGRRPFSIEEMESFAIDTLHDTFLKVLNCIFMTIHLLPTPFVALPLFFSSIKLTSGLKLYWLGWFLFWFVLSCLCGGFMYGNGIPCKRKWIFFRNKKNP